MTDNPNLIVIVEDDAGLRRALERLLRLSGFSTQSFGSAEDSEVSRWASSAQCLIVDVQLPGASGPAFYATLQSPRPPAVFVTAYDGAATREAVSKAGGQVLLTKPFLGDVLIDAVRKSI